MALQVGFVLSRSLDRLARALCLTRAEIYLDKFISSGCRVDVTKTTCVNLESVIEVVFV